MIKNFIRLLALLYAIYFLYDFYIFANILGIMVKMLSSQTFIVEILKNIIWFVSLLLVSYGLWHIKKWAQIFTISFNIITASYFLFKILNASSTKFNKQSSILYSVLPQVLIAGILLIPKISDAFTKQAVDIRGSGAS